MTRPKILLVVGPTGSGKTSLSIELAKQFKGEVVSADSRQVYLGLNIGSAKVTPEEMGGIPHHLLDVADPKNIYTAADWKRDAVTAIEDILARDKLPITCGGTFLYTDALLERTSFPEVEPNEALRAKLETKSTVELFEALQKLDPGRAAIIEKDNPRRLVRALEIATALGHVPPIKDAASPYDALIIGLQVDMTSHGDTLRERLLARLDQGLVAEVETLLANGVTHERLESFGLEYRYTSRYLRGEMEYDIMVDELSVKIRQFAKRQLTWLKRDRSIQWFHRDNPEIFKEVELFLG